jgi:hypothetical protein
VTELLSNQNSRSAPNALAHTLAACTRPRNSDALGACSASPNFSATSFSGSARIMQA